MTGSYVDLSSNNGWPDLQAYWNAGHRDLMLKATEGTGYAWAEMQQLARQWHALGGRVGYYHWLYGTLPAQAQYDWFWSHVGPVWQPGDWMMTDFEDVDPTRWVSDAQHRAVVAEFDRLCGQHGEVHDYAPNWYIASMPSCIAYFQGRLIVESDYTNSPPSNPHGFTIVAHQYTDRATVAGMPGPVDYNRWLIDSASSTGAVLLGDDMSAAAEATLAKLDKRIAAFDQMYTAIVNSILPAAADMQPRVQGIDKTTAKVGWSVLGDDNNPGMRALLAGLLTSVAAVKAAVEAAHAQQAAGQPVDLAPVLAAVNAVPVTTAHTLAQKLGA